MKEKNLIIKIGLPKGLKKSEKPKEIKSTSSHNKKGLISKIVLEFIYV